MIINHKFTRNCKKCNNKFIPTGKFEKCCFECKFELKRNFARNRLRSMEDIFEL